MSRHRRLAGLVVLAATTALAVVPAAASARSTVTMSGSTSVAPLAAKLARGYLRSQGRDISFRLLQGGSDIGISDVARGRVNIGNSSRDPKASDPGGLTFNKVARDGLCIATNPANGLRNISQEQVQAIFTGRIRNWSEVPGSGLSGPIDLVVRTAASGSQDAFQNIFLGPSLRVAGSASTKSSNGLVAQSLRSNRNAIGYVSFNFSSGTKPLAYRGVACSLRNAKSGQYGGTRNFWMVTRGSAKGATGKFLRWVRRSGAARRIIASNWVPLR